MPKIAVDSILDKEAVLDAESVEGSDLHKKLEINEIARKSVGFWFTLVLVQFLWQDGPLGQTQIFQNHFWFAGQTFLREPLFQWRGQEDWYDSRVSRWKWQNQNKEKKGSFWKASERARLRAWNGVQNGKLIFTLYNKQFENFQIEHRIILWIGNSISILYIPKLITIN